MLEQLVESKSNARENKRRGSLLATTFMIVACLCFSAILSSLFAMNPRMGDGELEMSSLIAPVIPADVKPEPVEDAVKNTEKSTEKDVADTTRQTNTLRIDESPAVPKDISVVPNTQKERPKGYFEISDRLENDAPQRQGEVDREAKGNGGGGIPIGGGQPKVIKDDADEMPEIKKPEPVLDTKKTITVTKGVINSQATSLPKPVYTQAARTVRAAGDVTVQVAIDETGRVVSAKAVSGNTLLRAESEKAARAAKFTPTLLSDRPVRVIGIIVYKFVL
jgi:hypothetical protein